MKEAIFMLGLPGSGKTTYINEINKEGRYTVVSADTIRLQHPNYDPKNPEAVHEECVLLAETEMYERSDESGGCENLIMDGGGINNKYTARIINKLVDRGYYIKVVFINTPVNICLSRNNERINLNQRYVPASVIINKSYKLQDCVNRLKQICDEFIQIDYFTDEHLFIDMDGVVAEYQDLPVDECGDINFVEYGVFKHAKPVLPVIDRLFQATEQNKKIYIVSASANSICNVEKTKWLEEHIPFIPKENIYFVGNKNFKTVFLRQLIHALKLNPKDCTFVDDMHILIERAKEIGVHSIHISKFLTDFND